MDDLTVRTGKFLDGVFYNDDEITEKLRDAVRVLGESEITWAAQPPEEPLASLGFDVEN